MVVFRVVCIQLCSGKDVVENVMMVEYLICVVVVDWVVYVQIFEMINFLVWSCDELFVCIVGFSDNFVLEMVWLLVVELKIYVYFGFFVVCLDLGKVVNWGFVFGLYGVVVVSYDKIYMFDVDFFGGESWCELVIYEFGQESVVFDLLFVCFGMVVCYDIWFLVLFWQ